MIGPSALASFGYCRCRGFCHSPVNFCAHSRKLSRSLLLTPAPIRAHSCAYPCSLPYTPAYSHSLLLTLMHEYRQENDKSPCRLPLSPLPLLWTPNFHISFQSYVKIKHTIKIRSYFDLMCHYASIRSRNCLYNLQCHMGALYVSV